MVNNRFDDMHVYRKRTYELLNVAKQGDFLSKLIDVALIVLILSNVLAIVLESVNEINQEYSRSFELFEWFSVSIFTVEYLARVWSSVEERDASGNELSRFKYIFTPSAIIDLIAILPFYIMLLGPSAVDLRILRVFRLLRIFKLTRYSQSMTLMLDAIREHIRSFIAAITVLVVVMLLAASGMYIFEREAQPDSFGSIPHGMWWAFATLTTVGYGDVTPITLWGTAPKWIAPSSSTKSNVSAMESFGPRAAVAIRHVANQNGVASITNLGEMPPPAPSINEPRQTTSFNPDFMSDNLTFDG